MSLLEYLKTNVCRFDDCALARLWRPFNLWKQYSSIGYQRPNLAVHDIVLAILAFRTLSQLTLSELVSRRCQFLCCYQMHICLVIVSFKGDLSDWDLHPEWRYFDELAVPSSVGSAFSSSSWMVTIMTWHLESLNCPLRQMNRLYQEILRRYNFVSLSDTMQWLRHWYQAFFVTKKMPK